MFAEKPLLSWLFETHVASQLSGVLPLRLVSLPVSSQPPIHTSHRYEECISMTSILLTRRAMLSGGAFVGLGALLAACGQQANNEGAATASAAPSETASASAVASESASASVSTTPKPVVTRGYSGGSKAPDGEYRKADAYGIAQNVPLPKAKPQQYPETFAGLREMMTDWVRARNYGIQTGDMQYVWPSMLDTYEKDIKFLKDIEGLYQRGG